MKARSTEHRFLVVCAAIGTLGLLAMGLLLDPDPRGYGTHEALGFTPCLPMEVWDMPCPGCGVTTAVTHAVHGQWLASAEVQPFGFLLFLVALLFIVYVAFQHFRGVDLGPWWVGLPWPRLVSAAAVAMLIGWGYKWAMVREWLVLP